MKTALEEFCDYWTKLIPEEEEDSAIEVDWYEVSGELSELIEKEQQDKNNGVLADVSEQRKLLFAFKGKWNAKNSDWEAIEIYDDDINEFLEAKL